ncbi:sugar phosphate isomerase/epimerase family protein [Candidatus Caldatribacterium sp.]|uniref:sugar phosphate isomerase/epimerase family protein n=1 Tax=Candidatus Caldatribacterium sp. TaxID=2282143 RepID=UPI00299864EA|nr:sugar phosphate isomerase/epimerase [Candidatus Caldatribacterium sp.]MDW8081260.1 sugar phosphate isomerase/epimerase family protein [Candidatus Calescibacterium sp.]
MGALRYAVHAYAWTSRWTRSALCLLAKARELGFDAFEVPLMDLEEIEPQAIRKEAEQLGLLLVTSTVLSEDTDVSSPEAAIRQRGIAYLMRCVEVAAEMGALSLSGVIYGALGKRIATFPGREYFERAAEVLREVARRAQEFGLILGIEPVNRYESFLINTCDQALELLGMVGEPNVRIHLDSYHMNIEENDFYTPTKKAAPYLCHYHLSESHRGIPGTGTVDWDGIFRALAESGYRGIVGMESFVEVSDSMRAGTCIWRKMAPSSDVLLREGLAFLRDLERRHFAL